MTIRRKNGMGNIIPTKGIQVMPQQMSKYTNWNSVNPKMYMYGTVSTNEACFCSKTLLKIKKNIVNIKIASLFL